MSISKLTWNEFTTYLFIERKMSESVTSVAALKSRFKKLVEYFSDKDFNKRTFNIFISELKKNGYTKKDIRKDYASSQLNNLIKMAKHIDKYLQINQLQDYTYFKENNDVPKDVLSTEEILDLASVVIPHKRHNDFLNLRQKTIILTLGTTGMRIGELLSIKWNDICSTTQYAYIELQHTKNGKKRKVIFSKVVHELIMQLPRLSEYIICSYRGGKLGEPEINLDLKRRAEAIGLKKNVYAHLFRHSLATELFVDGLEGTDVSDILGHVDPRTTLRYKHANLDHYYTALLAHPLLRSEQTWETVQQRVKNVVGKVVDASIYPLEIHQDENMITITIRKP